MSATGFSQSFLCATLRATLSFAHHGDGKWNKTNNSGATARVLEPGQGCQGCTQAIVLI